MMQADDAVHPALAACASLDSAELFDVDLDGGRSNVSAANASLPSPTSTSSAAHRSPSSPPPVPAMTGTSTNICTEEPLTSPHHERRSDPTPSSLEKARRAQKDETRKLSAYNLISPVSALEKAPSSDSITVTTTSSGSLSMSSSSSMLSAMDNANEEDLISSRSMDKEVNEAERNDRDVYHFKVSKVKPQMERGGSGSVTTRSLANIQSGEAKSNGEEIMSTEATSINEASQITTVSTMPGPDDNKERAGSDQRGVYRFKVQVDEVQLRKAEWWKLW